MGTNSKNANERWGVNALIVLALTTTSALAQIEKSDDARTYSPYANRDFAENLYWGDTHLHTDRSVDAYSFGNRLDADTAYRFARGETLKTQGGQPVRISRPLDFLVIADHAQYLGALPLAENKNAKLLASKFGARFRDGEYQKNVMDFFRDTWGPSVSDPQNADRSADELGEPLRRSIWETVTAQADANNRPGEFTAFIGYEWTSMPDGANLHRVVIFRDDAEKAKQVLPFGVGDSRDPEALWAHLASYEDKTGGKALAIPHNGNMSSGRMFETTDYSFDPMTLAYAKTRARWEPLYEMTQVKGDGETLATLSPDDLFADYETWLSPDFSMEGLDKTIQQSTLSESSFEVSQLEGEYARSGLKRGLELDENLGANPFKFGMIGSSDIHTSMTTVEENNFFSKMPYQEPAVDRADRPSGLFATKDYTASGLAAVWAHENTRGSIFDAMQRRETYATTGSRIMLRFFGGWNFEVDDFARPDYAAVGYRKGVPMGGDLTRGPDGQAPRFMIVASKDPDGANLERIQIVKGWIGADGAAHEKVWDVKLSDRRNPDRKGKMRPPIKSTVDIDTATYTNTVGEAQIAAIWEDPSFDPSKRAFYYVRVLEISTPRWTTYDAAFYGSTRPENIPAEQQERAYSSPIWYTP